MPVGAVPNPSRRPQCRHGVRCRLTHPAVTVSLPRMGNLHSVTRCQEAMRHLFLFECERAGNLPGLPAVYPDTMAPVFGPPAMVRANRTSSLSFASLPALSSSLKMAAGLASG